MAWRVGGEAGDIVSSSNLYTVPEPATITLLLGALGSCLVVRRRK